MGWYFILTIVYNELCNTFIMSILENKRKILKKIIEENAVYPTPEDSDSRNHPSNWHSLESWNLQVSPNFLKGVVDELSSLSIIEIKFASPIPIFMNGGRIFDEEGNQIDDEDSFLIEFIVLNHEALLEKLRELNTMAGLNPDVQENIDQFGANVIVEEGFFKVYDNGDIIYKDINLILRYQIKSMLALFIQRVNESINYSDLKDVIERSDNPLTNDTINKYITELNKKLKEQTGEDKKFIKNKIFKSEGYS